MQRPHNVRRREFLAGAGGLLGLPSQEATQALMETDAYPVRVRQVGYIQYIEPHSVLTLAREHDLVIRLLHKPGHNVWPGAPIAMVWPAARIDEELDRQICNAFRIGNGRTPTQDVIYAVNQLVEMAVRAMSPAINDPFTAMTCLDYIGQGLAHVIEQGEKSLYFYDHDKRLRLVLEPVTFDELLSTAFDMLRHSSCDNASVLLHMLEEIDWMLGNQPLRDRNESEVRGYRNALRLIHEHSVRVTRSWRSPS